MLPVQFRKVEGNKNTKTVVSWKGAEENLVQGRTQHSCPSGLRSCTQVAMYSYSRVQIPANVSFLCNHVSSFQGWWFTWSGLGPQVHPPLYYRLDGIRTRGTTAAGNQRDVTRRKTLHTTTDSLHFYHCNAIHIYPIFLYYRYVYIDENIESTSLLLFIRIGSTPCYVLVLAPVLWGITVLNKSGGQKCSLGERARVK